MPYSTDNAWQMGARVLAAVSILLRKVLRASVMLWAFVNALTDRSADSIARANPGSSPAEYAAGKNGAPGGTFARAAKRRFANTSGVSVAVWCMTAAQARTHGSDML